MPPIIESKRPSLASKLPYKSYLSITWADRVENGVFEMNLAYDLQLIDRPEVLEDLVVKSGIGVRSLFFRMNIDRIGKEKKFNIRSLERNKFVSSLHENTAYGNIIALNY